MKKFIALGIVLVATGATVWQLTKGDGKPTTSYRFVEVERGDLESVVTATGTLGAVTNVQVGTQVSGIVEKLYVDFNDHVRRGQLLARIDTTLLASAVRDARTNLDRNLAQRDYMQTELDRIRGLHERGFSTDVELNKAAYDLKIAVASVQTSEVSLERAERNLSYARIYSPIDGVVVERNVDEGQTVAASMNTPQLYLIANDLSRMQILASVDESDIGRIREGQEVRFTVQAFDEETFAGNVRQVRLQSATQENVVTYTVVVDVDNSDGRLLPGMTATVEFLTDKVTDVFKVANAALRFRPTDEMIADFRERMEARREERERSGGDSTRAGGQGAGFGMGGGFAGAAANGDAAGGATDRAMLWTVDEEGRLMIRPVRVGLTDGTMTEISGRDLEVGLQIIAGVTTAEESASANPFQQGTRQFGPRPGGF
jgi:HlyD family secretion protein